jgi:hypothetical protein
MTSPGPTVRLLEPGDLEVLQSIRRAAFEPVFNSFRSIVGEKIATLTLSTFFRNSTRTVEPRLLSGRLRETDPPELRWR